MEKKMIDILLCAILFSTCAFGLIFFKRMQSYINQSHLILIQLQKYLHDGKATNQSLSESVQAGRSICGIIESTMSEQTNYIKESVVGAEQLKQDLQRLITCGHYLLKNI
jgi:hypothetical protein